MACVFVKDERGGVEDRGVCLSVLCLSGVSEGGE